MPKVDDPILRIMVLAKDIAGINLTDAKRPLVQNRLNKRLTTLGLDLDGYADLVSEDPGERVHMIDLLTTNHTSFNRENAHFDDLCARVLPWVAERQRNAVQPRLRIWCAAASTGQEPYTISLHLAKSLPNLAQWDLGVLCTDISTRALDKARRGMYQADELQGLSDLERRQLCEPLGEAFRVREPLRRPLSFARLNLLDEWPMRGPFDVIFCRNVMIYFDNPTKERLVNRMHSLLSPGGTLYVGHTESLNALHHPYRLLRPSVYLRGGA